MKKMKTKRRKRIGISVLLLTTAFLLAGAGKKKAMPEAYSIVSGTVFKDSGFSLPDADVTLIPNPLPDAPPAKMKKIQATSDARGEFVFRVPATSMRYSVRASARGFHPEEKSVTVQGEERVEVTFQLREESK